MAFIKTKIVGCRKASIRRIPWAPWFDHDVVGEIDRGKEIEIDPTKTCYDWKDRLFYRTRNPKGWIHEGVIEYGEED